MEKINSLSIDDSVKKEIIDFCIEHKISVKAKADDDCDEMIHAPLSVLPSPFSKEAYEQVIKLQTTQNTLIINLMNNIPRVRELLHNIGQRDDFIGGLLKISEKVEKSEIKQKGYLGILRSDYMYDKADYSPKLIEFNTIASSFGVLSWGINQLHKHLITKYKMAVDGDKIERANNPHMLIVDGLKQAYDLYFGIVDNGKFYNKGKGFYSCLNNANFV